MQAELEARLSATTLHSLSLPPQFVAKLFERVTQRLAPHTVELPGVLLPPAGAVAAVGSFMGLIENILQKSAHLFIAQRSRLDALAKPGFG